MPNKRKDQIKLIHTVGGKNYSNIVYSTVCCVFVWSNPILWTSCRRNVLGVHLQHSCSKAQGDVANFLPGPWRMWILDLTPSLCELSWLLHLHSSSAPKYPAPGKQKNDFYGGARLVRSLVTLKLQFHSIHFAWCQQIWTIPIWPPVVSPLYRAFLIFIQNAPHFLPIICSQDRRTFQKPAAHRHLLGRWLHGANRN